MTFGIDISTHQATLDIGAAKAAGAQFVIVKSVASYLPQLTVADDYQNNIDRVIAAGLGHAKGHYAVPNSRNTPQATARFQFANRYRAAATDVYMLDDEPLDAYKTFWRDDDAAAYFEELHDLGIRYSQMWFYCPAFLTRNNGPWPKIEALRKLGLKIVWVSYGDNDSIREPGEEPLLGGGITGWDVHQFTSSWTVPGYVDANGAPKKVDGNYSPLSIATLFGGPVSLEDQMRQYIAANKKPVDAATWDQMCGSLMFRFNSWRGWVKAPDKLLRSATEAGDNSGPLNTDLTRAPIGAFHFFAVPGVPAGHVMQDARGGGLVCLTTGYAVSEQLGQAIGFQSVPGYVAAKRATYRGWATNYAGGTIDTSGLAGGGYDPIEEDDMFTEEDRARLNATYAGVFGARNLTGKATPLGWVNIYGDAQSANYGLLPVLLHNQTLISALGTAVSQLSGGGELDLDAIRQAAEEGAAAAAISAEDIAAIAALVAADVIASLPAGSDVTAEAIADELAKRLAA